MLRTIATGAIALTILTLPVAAQKQPPDHGFQKLGPVVEDCNSKDNARMQSCLGQLLGTLGTLMYMNDTALACPPETITGGLLFGVLIESVSADPSLLELQVNKGLAKIFIRAFPCDPV